MVGRGINLNHRDTMEVTPGDTKGSPRVHHGGHHGGKIPVVGRDINLMKLNVQRERVNHRNTMGVTMGVTPGFTTVVTTGGKLPWWVGASIS